MADIEAVKKQAVADVEAVKQKARNAIEILKREANDAKDEARALKASLDATKQDLENLRQDAENRVMQYERQISQLNEAVRSQEGKISDEREERLASLKAELSRAQEEIARLSQQSNQNANQNDSKVQEQLRKSEEKLAQLKEAAKNHVLKLQAEVAEKEKERKQAEELNSKLQAELADKDKARQEAEERAAKLQAELEQAKEVTAQAAAIPATGQDMAGRFEAAEEELQKATQLLEESEREKKAAQTHAAKLESDLVAFKEKAKKHVEAMQRELEARKEAEEKLRKHLDEEIKKVSESYETQIKALKDASATAAAAAASTSKSSPAPSDALLRMNKENKELQMKLESVTKSLQAERDDFKNQSKGARETIERLTKERTDLKREADSAKEEARVLAKDLEKAKQELKKLQDQKQAMDPTEMQKRKEQEIQVYVDRSMKLEAEIRKEQAKNEELTRQIQRFDSEVARLTGSHLEKYNKIEMELLDKREALTLLEEQNNELKRTTALTEQRFEDLRRKSREQFQSLVDQLETAKKQVESAKVMEEQFKAEIAALRRQSDKLANSAPSSSANQTPPTPTASPPPLQSSASATFKLLEEEKAKAESKRREAMDDLSKAKRDYNTAKREAIQLADAVERLRSGLNKAALQAGGNLAMAADRCDDALRQCVLQVEAALAAIQARELTKAGNPSQSAGLAEEENRSRHRQSSIDEPESPSHRKEQEPEERLVNALNEAENRLDEMTASLRVLLPKVKQVVSIAVQDKKNPSVLASICNLSAILAKLFNRTKDHDTESGYSGLQMQSAQRPSRRGRVLPDTPGTNFDLEEES